MLLKPSFFIARSIRLPMMNVFIPCKKVYSGPAFKELIEMVGGTVKVLRLTSSFAHSEIPGENGK